MEPRDYDDTPIKRILCFIRSVELIEGRTSTGSTIDLDGCSARTGQVLNSLLHAYIHTSDEKSKNSRQIAKKEKNDSGLMDAQRGQKCSIIMVAYLGLYGPVENQSI
jgi:hypothetical protein